MTASAASDMDEIIRREGMQAGAAARGLIGAAPLLFMGLHGLCLLAFPANRSAISLSFLILAPLLAAGACLLRARRTGEWEGWTPLALAMACWSVGMTATMAATLWMGWGGEGGLSMLLFTLYGVPLLFAVASPEGEAWHVRAVDGALALILGYLFFVYIFSFATMAGTDDQGLAKLRLMFDIQNVYIALFAGVRLCAAETPARRRFFGVLTLYATAYLLMAFYINHLQYEADYGGVTDVVIDMPFLALVALAIGDWAPRDSARAPSRAMVQAVRAGSPMMLPATLLTESVLLVWHRPELAVIGFVAASLGYGLRSVLTQMRGYAESERLEALSQVDGLTGVANRRAFDAALERECGRARRDGGALALAMIDIDHFKRLNDHFGHPEGDAALRAVAMALQGCARRGTDMVARYGGEEFAVILPGLGLVDAATQGERMRAAVEALGREAPVGVVTVSVGVSCGDDAGALLAAADKALYDAKESGRNRVGLR